MITVDGSGVVASSLADTRSELEQLLLDTFGTDLSLDPETPQGQFIGIMALALTEIGEALVAESNAFSVDRATGVQLDELGSLLGITRLDSSRSQVTATLTGVNGVNVPAGSRARTAPEGNEFRTLDAVTLKPAGVDVDMESAEVGPVTAPSGTLTATVTVIAGWETVTNSDDAILGRHRETDSNYRQSLLNRTAQNSIGPMAALESSVRSAGGESVKVFENNTDLSTVVQDWTIPSHSLLAIIESGTSDDVTRAIEEHRGMGVGTVTAIRGSTPNDSALQLISSGTISWDDIDYSGLDLTSTSSPAEKAAAVNALQTGGTPPIPIPLTLHHQDGVYVASYSWTPNKVLSFGTGSTETAFGLIPTVATASPGPFIRPTMRDLTITIDVTRRDDFPSNGITLLRELITSVVNNYPIGSQVWANDILTISELVRGTRVMSHIVQYNNVDISGVAVPADVKWQIPSTNLTITVI